MNLENVRRTIKTITIHCSDSDNQLHDNLSTIKSWHTMEPPQGRGWSDIGYHYVILKNGYVCDGRPIERIPASAKGHNKDTIAICLTGRHAFSYKQFEGAYKLTVQLMDHFRLTPNDIYPHNHFNPDKTCPNFDINQIKSLFKKQ